MAYFGGKFLIAKPSLRDPNFCQAVVLLIQHDDEGAFGLVLNRPLPVKELPCPVYAGGPCETEGFFLLHGNRDWAKDDFSGELANEIAPGIFLGDSSLTPMLNDLDKKVLRKVRMYAGYAGWGPGQLEQELTQGTWVLVDADAKTLFTTPAEELWAYLRPPSIPQPSVN